MEGHCNDLNCSIKLLEGLISLRNSDGLEDGDIDLGLKRARGILESVVSPALNIEEAVLGATWALKFKAIAGIEAGSYKNIHDCEHFETCVFWDFANSANLPRRLADQLLAGRGCHHQRSCNLNPYDPGLPDLNPARVEV